MKFFKIILTMAPIGLLMACGGAGSSAPTVTQSSTTVLSSSASSSLQASLTSSSFSSSSVTPIVFIEPEMVDIPAGSFQMGDVNGFNTKHYPNDPNFELPVHEVTIKAFKMSKYETTFAEYDAYVTATGKPSPNDLGVGRGSRPVGNVTWKEATDYAAWLSQKTGKKFRLPSESEWQYAARAGTTTEYYWGNVASHDFANYGTDMCCAEHISGADQWLKSAPVGKFPANAYGLFDMLGNISEYVQDCMNENYIGAPVNGAPWLTGNCNIHVSLGGQWHNDVEVIRVSSRNAHPVIPTIVRDLNFGFRLAQDN